MHSKERQKKGTVTIESYKGRLRLRLPRQLFEGKQKYLSLGLNDNPQSWAIAEAKVKLIESDILYERFDYTLAKYGAHRPIGLIDSKPKVETVTLKELWERFTEYKTQAGIAPCTQSKYRTVLSHINQSKVTDLNDALKLRMALFQVTTYGQVRESLKLISAACKWGIKHGICSTNPYEGLYRELEEPKPKPPVAFSIEQRDLIIKTFEEHKGNWNGKKFVGFSYKWYSNLIKFLFYTGCRPCEAIGLRWINVLNDFTKIRFCESIVCVDGSTPTYRDQTKTGIDRTFVCDERITALLKEQYQRNTVEEGLVFPSPAMRAINETNLNQRAFRTILKSLDLEFIDGEKMTLYNCRDTFITHQIANGVSSDIVARWVGNSAQVIEKKYLDKVKLQNLKPIII